MYRKGVIVDPDPRRGQVARDEPAIDGFQHACDQRVEIAVSPNRDLPMALLSRDEFGVELDEFAKQLGRATLVWRLDRNRPRNFYSFPLCDAAVATRKGGRRESQMALRASATGPLRLHVQSTSTGGPAQRLWVPRLRSACISPFVTSVRVFAPTAKNSAPACKSTLSRETDLDFGTRQSRSCPGGAAGRVGARDPLAG